MFRNSIYLTIVFSILAASCLFYKGGRQSVAARQQTHFVVIGCSAAGFHAARELVKHNQSAHVTCISEERSYPYNKTAFHSYVSKNKRAKKLELHDTNRDQGINFRLGTKVTSLNRQDKLLTFADGKTMRYDKLLIATGARPFVPENLSPALSWNGIRFYNSKSDVEDILLSLSQSKTKKVLMVGAGIRSLELADALNSRNPEVHLTIVNRSARFFGEHSDAIMDDFMMKRLKSHGVDFLAPMMPTSIRKIVKGGYEVDLDNGRRISTDVIVFTMGTVPNSELAKRAALELYDDGSLKVDSFLKTSDPDIFAAGDVVSFDDPLGSGVVRNSKWRAAKKQGHVAAANMLGEATAYHHEAAAHISSFFDMKVIISGNVRSTSHEASLVDADRSHYYRYVLENGRLKAFALVWEAQHPKPNLSLIRKALLQQSPVRASDLIKA